MQPRAIRNKNPGNLRPLRLPQLWAGQVALDNNPGGPFAIFDTVTHGFGALTALLVTYRQRYGRKSINAIFDAYAPPVENNTLAYKQGVARQLGVASLDADIDVTQLPVALALTTAIARIEAGAGIWWQQADQAAGVQSALDRAQTKA